MRKFFLKNSVRVTAAVMAAGLAITNPLSVEAKISTKANVQYNATTIIKYVDLEDDPGYEDGEGDYIKGPVTMTQPGTVTNSSVVTNTTAAVVAESGFDLTGIWTYLENKENNPVPIMVNQGNNTWLLAMYQGTTISLNFNGMGGGFTPLVLGVANNFIATAGTENGIVITGNVVGIDAVVYNLTYSNNSVIAAPQNVTLIISVVPAAPNTGNGVMTNGIAEDVVSSSNDSIDKSAINRKGIEKIQQISNSIFNSSMSDYEKVKATWNWMIKNITYDDNTYNYKIKRKKAPANVIYGKSPDSVGAVLDGLAICDGYVAIFNQFMRWAGIDSRRITGFGGNDRHAWNQVKLGGKWYNIDVTFGDEDDKFYAASANHDYFLVGTHTSLFEAEGATFYDKHKPDSLYVQQMEEATSNYPVDHRALWRENEMGNPNYRYDPTDDTFELIEGSPEDKYWDDIWDDDDDWDDDDWNQVWDE